VADEQIDPVPGSRDRARRWIDLITWWMNRSTGVRTKN
jgi:hypothetical protein